MTLEAVLLRNERPDEVKNEFTSIDEDEQGELVLQNSRYKTRARASNQVGYSSFKLELGLIDR